MGKCIFGILMLAVVLFFSTASAQVSVSLPSTGGNAGDTVEVPVSVGNLTGSGVIAFEFNVKFSHTVLSVLDIVTAGTVSAQSGWTVLPNKFADSIKVGAFGADALSGSGTLVKLRFRVIGEAGTSTPLTFTKFLFNAGSPAAALSNGSFIVGSPTVQVSIQTNPTGRSFSLDGTSYNATQLLTWTVGSQHAISTSSPQSGGTGSQYIFNNWSDGESISHTVTASAIISTYTANFTTQYQLTMVAGVGGAVSPPSGWQNKGQSVQINATANSGYSFIGWTGTGTGSYTGTNSPATVTMNSPITETASFTPTPTVTVTTSPSGRSIIVDGVTYTAPRTFQWTPGGSHAIGTTSPQPSGTGMQYVWSNWSDAGTMTHAITAPSSNTTYTASFTIQYYLTMTAGTGGTISPSSGWYNASEGVQISATANSGYSFVWWDGIGTGSYSGSNNPTTVTMNGPLTEIASYAAMTASIGPNCSQSSYLRGVEFWVEVRIGDPMPVTDLYGASFRLRSSSNQCSYVDGSAEPGAFLGTGQLVFFQKVDTQTIDAAVTKTSGLGTSGSGVLGKFKFRTSSSLTQELFIVFSLLNVQATNYAGGSIPLSLLTDTVHIGPSVWPGDCDNDGNVSGRDLLPIGLCYGNTRPGTNNPGIVWQSYPRAPWVEVDPPRRVYADANGDGSIDARDVLGIGINYGKSHSIMESSTYVSASFLTKAQEASSLANSTTTNLGVASTPLSGGPASVKPLGDPLCKKGSPFTIVIKVGDPLAIADLFGISFKLKSNKPTCTYVDPSADTCSFLGSDCLSFFRKVDSVTVDMAVTKTSAPGVNGSGVVAKAQFVSSIDDSVIFSLVDVTALDHNGENIAIGVDSTKVVLLAVSPPVNVVKEFSLSQNFPNPFNPSTTIKYELPRASHVTLMVYDVLGREVATLVNGVEDPGYKSVKWDASGVSSGVYFYRFQAGDFVATKKLLILR